MLAGNNNIVNSRRRDEDGGLELQFVVPSAIKETPSPEVHSGVRFDRFGVGLTQEHLVRFWWSGVSTFVGCNHVCQAGKADYLLSGTPLPRIMLSVVSAGVGIVSNVDSPIPPSKVSYDDAVGASVTTQRRVTAVSKTASEMLLTAQEAPSVLLRASFDRVAVADC